MPNNANSFCCKLIDVQDGECNQWSNEPKRWRHRTEILGCRADLFARVNGVSPKFFGNGTLFLEFRSCRFSKRVQPNFKTSEGSDQEEFSGIIETKPIYFWSFSRLNIISDFFSYTSDNHLK